MEGESSKARGSRPCREWEQDPLCFAHVRLLAFDLLALRPVPHMPGYFLRRGRSVRQVEVMGIVVTVDRKERYLRFTCNNGTLTKMISNLKYISCTSFFIPDVAPSPVHGDYLCHVVVDDGTGCVPCIFWTNYASFPATSPAKGLELRSRQEMAIATTAKVKLGDLLRVQGRLNTYTNQIQVTVASLRTEKDPNAEVLHWVECMRLAKCCYDLDPSLQKRPLVP